MASMRSLRLGVCAVWRAKAAATTRLVLDVELSFDSDDDEPGPLPRCGVLRFGKSWMDDDSDDGSSLFCPL